MDSSSRRRPLRYDDDLEEGEYVPGSRDEYSSDTDGERCLEGELGSRVSCWQEVVMASGRRVVRVPRSSSCESDGTISDDDGSNNPSADSSAVISSDGAPARRFACHVCGRGFSSPKAVNGHMRVHGNGRQVAVAVSGGWAGGKPLVAAESLNSESTDDDHSTAVVVAQPMPMAIAVTNPSSTPVLSSKGTNLSGEESSTSATTAQPMHYYEPPAVAATVVTGPNNPSSTGAVVVHHQQAAPLPAAEQPRPPVHQPAVPQPAAARLADQRPRQVYSCKLCGKSYPTNQGLGGHAAGHSNRRKEAEAASAARMMMGLGQDVSAFLAALRRGDRRGEKPHECQKCHKVFPSGVALGGHMRMHYTGPPIVHKRNRRRCAVALAAPAVSEADLRLALSSATEELAPSPAPAVAGRVRLFGVDIGPQVQQAPPSKEEEQQGSGTAEGPSSEGDKQ